MSIVTLFTDASWNQKTKIGVWAAWAKMDGMTIRHSGKFNAPMLQIGTAELGAISYGLLRVYEDFAPNHGSKIIAQTDSDEAILAIKNDKHNRFDDTAIVLHIKEFVRIHGWRLDLRHVKGHKGNATPRNAVNSWCDKECRKQMGLALGITKPSAEIIPFPSAQFELFSEEKSVG